MRKLSILFFSITILSFSFLSAGSKDNPAQLIEISKQFNDIKSPVESLSKELKIFDNQVSGIDIKLKFDYFFKIIEKLFEEQKSNLGKEADDATENEFEELQKNLNGLKNLIDFWNIAFQKLQILDLYLTSQSKDLSDSELLGIKINIFKQLYEDMQNYKYQNNKNKYVTNVVRACLPGKLYSAWFKYRDNCYKLVEIDLEKEEKYSKTYKEYIATMQKPEETKLDYLWFNLEGQKGDIQQQIDSGGLEKDVIKNLKLIKIVFSVLQVQLIKAKQELLNPVEELGQDNKNSDPLIRIKLEGIESELVVEIIKKLLATASPLNILKILISGGWERIMSVAHFVG